ncbi:uncharacterized protein LOC143364822 [Halictus rubicundus]|uniref:uncharacterized protein LOC143364822 n=1 Tax=Halictus rubicundus TaxID=77578 RepID=UPI004037150E
MINASKSRQRIQVLKQKQRAFKADLTAFTRYLTDYQDSAIERAKVKRRLERLNTQFDSYDTAQIELSNLEDFDENEAERQATSALYYEAIANADQLIESFHSNQAQAARNATISPTLSTSTTNPGLRLPKVSLPVFDGRLEDWVTFKDSFVSMIHNHPGITDIQRFNYLRSSVTGQAKDVIRSFTVSEENYNAAWQRLIKSYDNKRALIRRHATLLLNSPAMPERSANALKNLSNHLQLHVRSLKALGRSMEDIANDFIASVAIDCMDKQTRETWESTLTGTDMPSAEDIFQYIDNASHQSQFQATTPRANRRDQAKSETQPSRPKLRSRYPKRTWKATTSTRRNSPSPVAKKRTFVANTKTSSCTICRTNSHPAYLCPKFLNSSIEERWAIIKTAKLCYNHFSHNHTFLSDKSTNGLLTTAKLFVFDRNQKPVLCRTLIDTCSNANLITEELANRLQLTTTKRAAVIEALNQVNTTTQGLVTATVKSRLTNFKRTLNFHTIPRIAGLLPDCQVDRTTLRIPANLRLADPEFHRPGRIDMLLGTGPALSCLSIGQINLSRQLDVDLILQKTQFGWILGGDLLNPANSSHNTFVTNVQFDLQKFWEVEEAANKQFRSADDQACEDHFVATIQRDKFGRYMVALPFNERKNQLGESHSRALNRFAALERKFTRDPILKEQYAKVLNEYLELGHMQPANSTHAPGYYLPHHAVIKPSSTTTKTRVVFDGSAKTTTNLSLNDTLRIGPTIQDDLFSLLLRFRMHAYVLTGDIEKMYRQFLVQPEDRAYQRILWRDSDGAIATFELNTVTFGLAPAPYLAIRCLHQLAIDEERDFPEAAMRIKRDLYVDDLLTGTDSIREARALRRQITSLLQRGGLNIRQWASNAPELLAGLSDESIHPKILGDSTTIKTLGISWNARQDTIRYSTQSTITEARTKRTILSIIARIYDPLGLLGPITIVAKILMQQLWMLKLSWDESLPVNIHTVWDNFESDLRQLDNVEFNRFVRLKNAKRTELHGFCDASEKAYGACLYVRTISQSGIIRSSLLCAKSRVAPLSQITLARLELCSAALLTTLLRSVQKALIHNIDEIFCWTDSTIVLNWLHKQPSTLKTFVANRVADIQRKTDIQSWRHVRSADNPADLISRGTTATEFVKNQLWRHGPNWLNLNSTSWPSGKFSLHDELPEQKSKICLTNRVVQSDELLTRYSCIQKLKRIVAYCLRFRLKPRVTGPLTIQELSEANHRVIHLLQAVTFAREIQDLRTGRISNKSQLQPLCPFLDERGILRVGGRLRNSTLPFAQKHPILLPRGHHVTKLIIRDSHVQNHHTGIVATLHNVRQTYWPIDGKNTSRQIVRKCIRCFRVKPPTAEYLMGNLPADRVTEGRPFINSGVDYCGPFYIKERQFRNRARVKVYVAVFVCFATKAIHLEVVGDLTTEAFIAALKRFIARRGICKNIYSDNGTNFVGANNELREIHQAVSTDQRLRQFLTAKEMSWHFMPALSPHFGGLWEAAVKSFKHHIKRVVGEELFTYEQFATFAIEIEAILNSRPLTPLSPDPNDLSALTPGHFLIGHPLTCPVEVDFSTTPTNRLSTWQHIQKVKQDFWTRWHKEYIHQLNLRHKWTQGTHNIKQGTLVLLKEDNLPPLCWQLGRITQTHPGTDGIIRAVSVQTIHGIYKRNVTKLAPLPNMEDAQSGKVHTSM